MDCLKRINQSPDLASDFIERNQKRVMQPFENCGKMVVMSTFTRRNCCVHLLAKTTILALQALKYLANALVSLFLYPMRGLQLGYQISKIKISNRLLLAKLGLFEQLKKDPNTYYLFNWPVNFDRNGLCEKVDWNFKQNSPTFSREEVKANFRSVWNELDHHFRQVYVRCEEYNAVLTVAVFAKPTSEKINV